MLLFGATGMVGQGVLRECLRDSSIARILSVVRRPTSAPHEKVEELVHGDFHNFAPLGNRFREVDACLFCLGVSAVGMKEADYEATTYGITLAAAKTLADARPDARFLYVSGAGTDSTERGRAMWARVKGKTENALLREPKLEAYMFRPGFIQPMDGIKSRTRLYRVIYGASRPLAPLVKRLFPNAIVTTRELGRAMVRVAAQGAPKRILEIRDIAQVARSPA